MDKFIGVARISYGGVHFFPKKVDDLFSPQRWQAILNTLAVEMWYRAHKNDVYKLFFKTERKQ